MRIPLKGEGTLFKREPSSDQREACFRKKQRIRVVRRRWGEGNETQRKIFLSTPDERLGSLSLHALKENSAVLRGRTFSLCRQKGSGKKGQRIIFRWGLARGAAPKALLSKGGGR